MSQANVNTAELLLPVLESILDEIGTAANALQTGLVDLNCNPEDAARGFAYIHSTVAERIGWLADLGLTQITGSPQIVGDAEQWFMSPAYHDTKAKLAGKGGKS